MKSIFVTLSLLVFCLPAYSSYQVEKLASGLRIPWSISFLDDSTILATERNGNIVLVNFTIGTKTRLLEVPNVAARGQGGLLDIALSPYDTSTFYFTYSKNTDTGADTTLAVATFKNNKVTDWKDLLVTQSNSDTTRHFGSRIVFADKHLFSASAIAEYALMDKTALLTQAASYV